MIKFTSFFFSSRRRHTRSTRDWSSDVCSSDLHTAHVDEADAEREARLILGIYRRFNEEIGRASCRGKSVDLGGRRMIKKKKRREKMGVNGVLGKKSKCGRNVWLGRKS